MTPWQETAALRNFDPADVCFGSEAAQSTEATGLAMSGLLPKLT
jgi:hypothetical protein